MIPLVRSKKWKKVLSEGIPMAKHKKIQLKKRSGPAARIHRGLSMPVGPGSDSSTLSFRSLAELKAKYFVFTGRLPRRSFIMRTLVLMFAQLIGPHVCPAHVFGYFVQPLRRSRADQPHGLRRCVRHHLRAAFDSSHLVAAVLRDAPLSRHEQAGSLVYHTLCLLSRQLHPADCRHGYGGDGGSVDYGRILFGLFYREGDVWRQRLRTRTGSLGG